MENFKAVDASHRSCLISRRQRCDVEDGQVAVPHESRMLVRDTLRAAKCY